jgi:hypothetical protein
MLAAQSEAGHRRSKQPDGVGQPDGVALSYYRRPAEIDKEGCD